MSYSLGLKLNVYSKKILKEDETTFAMAYEISLLTVVLQQAVRELSTLCLETDITFTISEFIYISSQLLALTSSITPSLDISKGLKKWVYNVGLKSIKNTLVIFRHFLLTTKTQNSSLQSDNCYDGVKSGVADAYLNG